MNSIDFVKFVATQQPNATPPPTSPTEMAYSYKKSHRYGNACSPDSSSNYTPNCQPIIMPEQMETSDTPKVRSPTPPTVPSLAYASQTSTPASMTYEPHRTSPFSYMLSSANNIISHVPSSTYSPPLSNGHYERISNHSLSPSGSLLSLQGMFDSNLICLFRIYCLNFVLNNILQILFALQVNFSIIQL